jgi:hypothetical protein
MKPSTGTCRSTNTQILAVVVKVLAGERPPRGVWFEGSLWKLLEQCWTSQPYDRPSVEDVLRCLEMVSNLLEPHSPGADEEMEGDSDSWDSESGSSDVSNWVSGTMRTEDCTAMSSILHDGFGQRKTDEGGMDVDFQTQPEAGTSTGREVPGVQLYNGSKSAVRDLLSLLPPSFSERTRSSCVVGVQRTRTFWQPG